MKIQIGRRDIIWNYASIILSLATNIILLPFITKYLTGDELGLWYLFQSLGGITVLFDFGFNATFARNITYCWSGIKQLKNEGTGKIKDTTVDYVLMKKILVTCRWIYLIISFIAFICLVIFGTIYLKYVTRNIETGSYLISWLLYSFAVFLNLYYGYFSSFLRGVGAIAETGKITVISKLAQLFLSIILLFVLDNSLMGVCIAYLVYGVLFRILAKRSFYSYRGIGNSLSEINIKYSLQELKGIFTTIWHNAWREGIISLSQYICNQASSLICGVYLSLTETGIYSLCVQLATVIANVSTALYSTYQPPLQETFATGNSTKRREIMANIVAFYCYVYALGTLGLFAVGVPLLRVCKPDLNIQYNILLLVCVYQFELKFRNCFASYFSCSNRLPYVKDYIIYSILGLVLSWIALSPLKLGLLGLMIALIFSQGIVNFWYWAYLSLKEMNCSILDLFALFNIRTANYFKNRFKNKG